MRKYYLGAVLGASAAIGIVVTNVISPDAFDKGASESVAYFVFMLVFTASGYLETRGRGELRAGAMAGAVTALVSASIALLTYVVVDNVYLDIVSRQADKAWGFAHSNYQSMREYVNWSLIKEILFGLPVAAVVGAMFGALGASFTRPTPKKAASKQRQRR